MTISQVQEKLNQAVNAKTDEERAKLCRETLTDAVGVIFEKAKAAKPKDAALLELLNSPTVTDFIGEPDMVKGLDYARIIGMNAQHGRKVRKKEVQLALDNVTWLAGLLAARETGEDAQYRTPPYMSEATTRRLYIDNYLREAGWEVLEKENQALPGKAGIEIEVQGMPNAHGVGYCDYVLYGRDGRPLAIVEVKKTTVNAEKGRHQADLYGDCMKAVYGYKPVLYYTNGYHLYIIDGIYPDRKISAFHTMEELERMIQKRNRGPIRDLKINSSITNRYYQKMAITNIAEWLNANHRRGLLVMATGTGKTRVAISLVDILTRNNWVKNVLFLADRTSLVNQAKRNFAKLMPDMSVCELSGSEEKDYNARLMFCTYQTMINYIDAEEKRFSTGRFDLIIIDEAHRSIFNRYGTIFEYFDSFLVGLTATPKNEVDSNTYRIFGCEAGIPNFDYSMEQAVTDKYLVGYHVINRTSKLISEGIKYDELTEDEKKQLEEYFGDEEIEDGTVIPGSKLYQYLFNRETCRQVLEDLMTKGHRVDGGETLGKSIIFAYNHDHAQMIVDCFRELYPQYGANYCQLVDYSISYGNNLVIKFDEDKEFRIAVSVDMLDTGVDIPAVLNLVFFKKVRSKIKFVQMIGRGTRLCENVYGPGKHKNGFLIFDYCGNFEYFNIHADGKEGKEHITLSQRLFMTRMDMLYTLQAMGYQEDTWYQAYYEKIKVELHGQAVGIKANSNRIQVRNSMQHVDKYYDKKTWVSLSKEDVKEAKTHLAPLLDSGLNGDFSAVSYDVRMYHAELALLRKEDIGSAADDIKNIRLIAKFLIEEKASVPAVKDKAADLRQIMSEEYWKTAEVPELERMRISLREVMQFAKEGGQKKFDIDISDTMTDADFRPDDTAIDIRTYREKVIDYLADHSDSEVIRKIKNLEAITGEDLKELEAILWHELGTQEEYRETTDKENLAAFVRSLVGLSVEAVNEKFGEYLSGNVFNSRQQEFIRTIIEYVQKNGDVELEDLVNTEPFSNFDLAEVFGARLMNVVEIVKVLHGSITVGAA